MVKYVLVAGGVLSGIGKGVISSSTGVLLQAMGLRVTCIKIDPYLNCDAGTMNPFEHGEVFVLEDGGEVDLDLGNYERFVGITLSRDNNITTGKIYLSVIEKERRGDYLGKTVQVVPHICDAIQDWVERVSRIPADGSDQPPDVCVIELGGTVGDIESSPFLEAMRQFQFRVGHDNFCCLMVTLVPVLGVVGEQKTKPTQMSAKSLRELGISPDFIACRSSKPLLEETKRKISSFCHVPPTDVLGVHDVNSLYDVPLLLQNQDFCDRLVKRLHITAPRPDPSLDKWMKLSERANLIQNADMVNRVRIVIVGKYTGLKDSYLSVIKGLQHAAMAVKRPLKIDWVSAEDLEAPKVGSHDGAGHGSSEYDQAWQQVKKAHGVLVPGGFGDRGVEGKILACKYAREHKKPFLGICLGMQVAVIEFARSVLGWTDANSMEFNPETANPVVVFMPEVSKTHMGGTMRLGARTTIFTRKETSKLYKLYGQKDEVSERHRHRYEVNPDVVGKLTEAGLCFAGQDESGKRQIIVEDPSHPYFVGTQFHPEFKSRPLHASPPFIGLVAACAGCLDTWLENPHLDCSIWE